MGSFSKVLAGTRARVAVIFPFAGSTFDVETGEWTGPHDKVDLRALNNDEHAEVLQRARAFAQEHGIENPETGDALYDQGVWIHTLAIACLDPDSSPDKPQPYFDKGWEQIQKSELLTPEIIAYVFQLQEMHQDEVNPLAKTISPEEFWSMTAKLAGGDQRFFVNMRRGLQWIYVRSSASRLLASRDPKSESTPRSESPPTPPASL